MTARVEHLVTSGTFSLDGQTFDVDNNVWLLGDDEEVLVVDAPHDPDAIAAVVGYRDLERATWRTVQPLPPAPPPTSAPIREALPVPVTLVVGERAARYSGGS